MAFVDQYSRSIDAASALFWVLLGIWALRSGKAELPLHIWSLTVHKNEQPALYWFSVGLLFLLAIASLYWDWTGAI
jgi:hypothetical protein